MYACNNTPYPNKEEEDMGIRKSGVLPMTVREAIWTHYCSNNTSWTIRKRRLWRSLVLKIKFKEIVVRSASRWQQRQQMDCQERRIAKKLAPHSSSLILLAMKEEQKQETNQCFKWKINTEVKLTTFPDHERWRQQDGGRTDCRINNCCFFLENPPTCKELS